MVNNQQRQQAFKFQFCSAFAFLLLLLLAGCGRPDAEDLWLDYHSRLQRILVLPDFEPVLLPVPTLPPVRELYQPLPTSKLNLLDLVVLRRCGLQQLLAERNNSLGKTMTVANQLGYELQLLNHLKPCLQHKALDAELQHKLQLIYQDKLAQLPKVLANFLLTDQTLRQQLHGSQRTLKPGASATTTITALQQLVRLQQQLLQRDAATIAQTDAAFINLQVGALYKTQLLADWQYSLRLNNSWLTELNQQLAAVDLREFCHHHQAKDKTEILRNILLQRFIGKIQPYLAELDGISQQLLPLIRQIYQQSVIAPVLYQRTESQHQQLQQQLRWHVAWWQQLQQQCQVNIAANPN